MRMVLLKIFTAAFATSVLLIIFFSGHEGPRLKTTDWAFDGMTGKVDKAAARRGHQVYREVCAGCHGLRLVAYRNLGEIGYSEDQIKEFAAEYSVMDGPDDEGEMFERDAKPSDKFVSPFANEKAARAGNGGAFPPDLSLIIKARHDGANYLYSLMQGYKDEAPENVILADGMSYNQYFGATKQIAMPQPLMEDSVEYEDGTPATLEQMSKDVVVFLQWAAEPEMETRKRIGVGVLAFMFLFTILFYYAKKRVWARLKDE